MSVVAMPAPPSRSLRAVLMQHSGLLSALGVGVLGALITVFCWQWQLPEIDARLTGLCAGGCVWMVAILASFMQERRAGRIAAGLMASCPLLIFFACWGAVPVVIATLALGLVLMAAYLRWGGQRFLILPITLVLALLLWREPSVGLALVPLVLWATGRVPMYQRLTALGLLALAWWSLALPLPTVSLRALTQEQRLQRLLFLAIAALPLGLPALVIGLPRLSRLTRLLRDERPRFLALALLPGIALLVLGGPRETLLLTLTPLYLLFVALTLGESRETWPEAATAALIVANVALLFWPLPATQVAAGWPGLVTLHQETRHWQDMRNSVLRAGPKEGMLVLCLPEDQVRLSHLLPGYTLQPLSKMSKRVSVMEVQSLILTGRRLQVVQDALGLQLMDRYTGRTRRLTLFVPAEIEALPGSGGEVWRITAREARTLRLGEELLLTR
ncbi:MAG: hypothetical protein QM758_20770 [Armatimonas sp.]